MAASGGAGMLPETLSWPEAENGLAAGSRDVASSQCGKLPM